MPRPQKCRRVAFLPRAKYFKPSGIPLRVLDEIVLHIEEAEAIRLKDLNGMEQEEAAGKMNISRPTFQRVLASARQKIADAILNGKAIRIDGGNFEMSPLRFKCTGGHEWEMPFEDVMSAPSQSCPSCNTPDVTPMFPAGSGRGGRGRRGHYKRGG